MLARHRRQLVGAMALGLAGLAVWMFSSQRATPPHATVAPNRSAERVAGAPQASGAGTTVPVVAIELLQNPRPEPIEAGRDLFRFGAGRRLAEDADPASGIGRRDARAGTGQRPGDGTGVDPSAPAPPPPILLKFIGVVRQQSGSGMIAVLSDSRGVYYGREGDVIEGRYRIVRISDEAVELVYVDGRGRQTIRLSGA